MKNRKINKLLSIIALLICVLSVCSLCACGTSADSGNTVQTESALIETAAQNDGLWANAVYTADTELGEGEKAVTVEVSAEDTTVTFTIHTDAETLGDALIAHGLISGEESEYGLYVKEVNGIKADYDTDKAYWASYKDGEYLQTGVDTTKISDGDKYELVYTKG